MCECRPSPKRRIQSSALSRCDIFQLSAAKRKSLISCGESQWLDMTSLTSDDCLDVVEFIERNGEDRSISLRFFEPQLPQGNLRPIGGTRLASARHDPTQDSWRKEDTSRRIDARLRRFARLNQAIERFPPP